ncbi:uncharacterized protein LOC131153372 [Malania oleifera]|uniref:uncharacterized protein LOC131153372 n=1 Tax=Malania oleifera TaxID=397392 RepID=UPI0025ADF852|nr:uncharacterized protein LOC131153372 [Malania oleifera]
MEKPPKPLSPFEWEALIDDFQYGGSRREKWTAQYSGLSLLDLALSSLLRRDFPLKLHLIVFLEEYSDVLFKDLEAPVVLGRLFETFGFIIQSPIDGFSVTYALKEQLMVSSTSILISIDGCKKDHVPHLESFTQLFLTIINRPNHGLDRNTRAVACECLRELEMAHPGLLADVAGHLWSLCQSERTHASQSYLLLLASVIHNVVTLKMNVSIFSTAIPLIPFNVPHFFENGGGWTREVAALSVNYKELRRVMAFLLEWPQVFTPCGMMEFMSIIMPVAVVLELQASLLKVQFSGLLYSNDPVLCHVVLRMYSRFLDASDGREGEIAHRLMLISREAQHQLVFRLLALNWLLGFITLISNREVGKKKSILEMGLNFHPTLFDPLALKALKLDLLALICLDISKFDNLRGLSSGELGLKISVAKLFEDGLVSVSAFKWLPPWSTETAVAFRTFHKFLIGASSHYDSNSSATKILMESTVFHMLQTMLVDMTLEFQRLVPVVIAFIDRLLGCQKHSWLGERLLQIFDEHLLPKVIIDYRLASYFPIFDRIAQNNTIPPRGLLELLTNFMAFLVHNHGPDTGLNSWSQGSKVLSICRTMLMHHHSSRLFMRLSRLLSFTCLYFPDLEVRDNARIYLRMLICIPGRKLRYILNLEEHLPGMSSSAQSSSFFSAQSQPSGNFKKSRNISSYIFIERVIPLLVKQSWSLSLPLGSGSDTSAYLDGIRDNEPLSDEGENPNSTGTEIIAETERIDTKIIAETKRIDLPPEPLRVMDSKFSELLVKLRQHFSCIPDFRNTQGLKIRISCSLRFLSGPFNQIWGVDLPDTGLDEADALPALYATVLTFSSSAPYGSIPPYHIPFLLGEHSRNDDSSAPRESLDIVPVENGSGDEECFKAPVVIELKPREPMPGLVNVAIETNAGNGSVIRGLLQSITIGIEDMFLKAIVPSDIPKDAVAGYYFDLFNALWEACGNSSSTGRETFPLRGGKGVAAISGTRSVKLLEVPATSLIQAIERHVAPFVVSVIGETLVSIVKDRGIISDVIWKDMDSDSAVDDAVAFADSSRGPLHLKYIEEEDDDEKECHVSFGRKNMGFFLVLIFLPPRFHLLFQMEVHEIWTLVRIRTDHWPCLAYIDDYLEALFPS